MQRGIFFNSRQGVGSIVSVHIMKYFFLTFILLFSAYVSPACALPTSEALAEKVTAGLSELEKCSDDSCVREAISKFYGPATRAYISTSPNAANGLAKGLKSQFSRVSDKTKWGNWGVANETGEEVPVRLIIESLDKSSSWKIPFVEEDGDWKMETVRPSMITASKP